MGGHELAKANSNSLTKNTGFISKTRRYDNVILKGEDFTVSSCKSKVSRNPLYRWQIGTGAINKFEFSGPSSNFMATIGQDGHLRIFNWKRMELIGSMKSYFGGLLCLAWSPDLRYIATGGEDDMLSLYSVAESNGTKKTKNQKLFNYSDRVVCRGQGHKSWISDVAFDPFATFTSPSSAENYIESTTGYCTQTNEVVVATSTESMFIDSNGKNYISI
jgi:WD40 repeat protein